MKFESYFTKNNLKNILDYNHKNNMISYETCLEENFLNPIKLFLIDLNKNNKLSIIQNSQGHSTVLSHHWNDFIEKKNQPDDKAYSFMQKIIYIISSQYDLKLIHKKLDEIYSDIVNYINLGKIQHHEIFNDYSFCHSCSQEMKLTFNDWQPQFLVFEQEKLVSPKKCF